MGTVDVEITPDAVWAQLRRDWLLLGGECREVGASERGDEERGREGEGEIIDDGIVWNWIGDDWFALVDRRREQLARYASEHKAVSSSRLIVLIADADPVDFLAGVWAALLSGWTMAMANAQWGLQEWQSAHSLIQPQIIWPTSSSPSPPHPLTPSPPHHSSPTQGTFPAILIPTGGTSGQIKFAHHTWQTLVTAVTGFHQHFLQSQTTINAYCVLPLYHVSGLLQALRTALTNGQLFLTSFKTLLHSPSPPLPITPSPLNAQQSVIPRQQSVISLVPTQLNRLLNADKSRWLSQFHAVLLGGAPPWLGLLERSLAYNIPISLSYGMTETAAMVSATDAQSFLQGHKSLGSGHAMPHATIQIEEAGKALPAGHLGQIVVKSNAIALGYYNAPSPHFAVNTFYTDDLGYLDTDGHLHVTGRASGKIISGGENVFPAEVEAALRSTGQVSDVCVVGLPHSEWGEAVSAAYVPTDETVSPKSLKAALVQEAEPGKARSATPTLSRYKVPKYWFSMKQLPRNAQGKLNRSALLAELKTLSSASAQQ